MQHPGKSTVKVVELALRGVREEKALLQVTCWCLLSLHVVLFFRHVFVHVKQDSTTHHNMFVRTIGFYFLQLPSSISSLREFPEEIKWFILWHTLVRVHRRVCTLFLLLSAKLFFSSASWQHFEIEPLKTSWSTFRQTLKALYFLLSITIKTLTDCYCHLQ